MPGADRPETTTAASPSGEPDSVESGGPATPVQAVSGKQLNEALGRMSSPTRLLTNRLLEKLPPLGATAEMEGEEFAQQPVLVKFFTPAAGWTWFGMEYDAGERVFWGYVESGLDPSYDEFGYFSLDELESLGARVERDLHFEPTPIGKVQAERGRH